ncbi:NAD(P)-dependent oxidoreductase [Pacificimonas sp. WHA3]|uniref:NAD(P)-dependent oxidoreductase n=1 Tax=Pacificimonas pallii TaxID=2827236 RepID=A0ABS6SAY1_9SPHN|nr:NAD(P)-dependent oxidoreductase [Pacificimonas pallii]MBV7255578.1 NAD(P)-dependent oxidoreductase [Pacificimonas pallii]
MKLAITGGTGFVGQHLIERAVAAGHGVTALTRRGQPSRSGVTWTPGDLSDDAALMELCTGADAVIHVAGVVNAKDEAGFRAGNVEGTRTMLRAAAAAGVKRFIHVSSLSAREPGLSLYGASKAKADRLVEASGLDWTIVRPPAVYGPGETEMLDLYRLAAKGWGVVPGKGRFSLIYVTDLADALIALAASGAGMHGIFEIEDGSGGLDHRDMAKLIGDAVGTRPRALRLPLAALNIGAAADTLRAKLAGGRPKLSFDRARYIAHPDWTADVGPLRALGIWQPHVPPHDGVKRTADWYRQNGMLR